MGEDNLKRERESATELRLQWTRRQSLRDVLIEGVRRGRWMPDAAEAQAAKRGLGALSHEPDPSLFDPMKESDWDVPMALAWRMWGTPDAVRQAWDKYRCKRWVWEPIAYKVPVDGGAAWEAMEGYQLKQPAPANLSHLEIWEMMQTPKVSLAQAVADLRAELRAGRLVANIVNGAIPRDRWAFLAFRDDLRGHRKIFAGSEAERHDDVKLEREAIMSLWPGDRATDYRTGGPGKPSPYPLVESELRERALSGRLAENVTLEAAALEAWLKKNHPKAPRLKAKSIKNRFSSLYRELKADAQK